MTEWTVLVTAGTGPQEVRRFVGLLAPALAQRCRHQGLTVVSTASHGQESTPRSVEICVRGDASAALCELLGTHVLVARSQRRGRRARKRWYAGVSLHRTPPSVTSPDEVALHEVEITAARAGGPGGQHVNTTDSAVRVVHLPTGIRVRVASERSQHRNRSRALARIAAMLAERQRVARSGTTRALRAAHYQFERGRPVRQWVVDQRTAALQIA